MSFKENGMTTALKLSRWDRRKINWTLWEEKARVSRRKHAPRALTTTRLLDPKRRARRMTYLNSPKGRRNGPKRHALELGERVMNAFDLLIGKGEQGSDHAR